MSAQTTRRRLGFFTRILDEAPPAERYANALEQFVHADELGFDTGWVAQHHFHEAEGGLASPFVLLAQAAVRTTRIRLATGIVTLPLELPLRVAEDAATLSVLSGGRVELGIGSGGTPSSFPPFGQLVADRASIYDRHRETLVEALGGAPITSDGGSLYPPAPELLGSLWEATFSVAGAERIGRRGGGLMLSRTQPRTAWHSPTSTEEQEEMVDAYLASLPRGVEPRILASRSLVVVDTESEAATWRERALERGLAAVRQRGVVIPGDADQAEILAWLDVHVGTPDQVIESLAADTVLARATEVAFQPHPVDPPHPTILRSLELIATRVAPASVDWAPASREAVRKDHP